MMTITAAENREILESIWHGYVSAALASGQLICKPDPVVVKVVF